MILQKSIRSVINVKKKDPWQIKFIDRMLLFSKLERNLSKEKISMKKFQLASFSIDTGAKLYADKVDALYEFVSIFLQGLFKQKTHSKNFLNRKTKISLEKIITLKTNVEKYDQSESKLEKITFFFCKPIFEKKNFDFFIKNSKKLKKMRRNIKKHKKAYEITKNYNFKIFKKTSNLLHRKETYFQRILQVICLKKNFLNLIIANTSGINFRKRKIFVDENFEVEMFSQNSFSGDEYFKKESLNKNIFSGDFSRKNKQKKNFLLKKEKKLFFFDLKKKRKSNHPKAFYVQKCEKKIFKNFGLISWENFLLKIFFFTKKNLGEIAEYRKRIINFSKLKNNFKIFRSKKKEENLELNFTPEAYLFENFQETNVLGHKEKPKFLQLKIQDLIISIDASKLALSKKSIQKINLFNVFEKKTWCIYNVFYPLKLFEKVLFLSEGKKKKENFFYYFICFLHSAFQKKDILVGDITLNLIFLLSHKY
jgi:hypothetical protein